jgi:hypothetical protein
VFVYIHTRRVYVCVYIYIRTYKHATYAHTYIHEYVFRSIFCNSNCGLVMTVKAKPVSISCVSTCKIIFDGEQYA